MSKIMIGIPVKNSAKYLPRFFKALEVLTYPKENLRLAFMYGDSHDDTLKLIKDFAKTTTFKVEVYKEPVSNDMRIGGIQLGAELYIDMQHVITEDEDYFMLLDCDLVGLPPNLIEELIDADADIVAPYPWSEGHRHFYDNWIFRIDNVRFAPQHPPGEGLDYPILVDSVGTCFLARREVFINTPIQNPYPNMTFCLNAKQRGFFIVACPYLEVFHIDLEKMGIFHNPLSPDFGLYPKEGWLTSQNYKPMKWSKKSTLEQVTTQSEDITKQILSGYKPNVV